MQEYPLVAPELIERYFALGEHFDIAQAHVEKAEAMIADSNIEGPLSSFEAALERERQHPSTITQAYLDFACAVVEAELERFYARALDVLDHHGDRLMFPVDRYRAQGHDLRSWS